MNEIVRAAEAVGDAMRQAVQNPVKANVVIHRHMKDLPELWEALGDLLDCLDLRRRYELVAAAQVLLETGNGYADVEEVIIDPGLRKVLLKRAQDHGNGARERAEKAFAVFQKD